MRDERTRVGWRAAGGAGVLVIGLVLAACASDDGATSSATAPATAAAAVTEVTPTTPVATEPVATAPDVTEPVATEPDVTEPTVTEPSIAPAAVGVASTAPIGTTDRPATLFVPSGYDPATPAPLVVLLHGYTSNGEEQDAYFGMRAEAEARGYLYVHPDGTVDPLGNQFWNATDACCDFVPSGVDDSGYVAGLIEEVQAGWAVDPGRVYVVGHSNGGFMSYRMACDHADLVAAIVSLAGATFDDPTACTPSQPVSVAQVHGTADQVVAYEGGTLYGDPTFPSAPETVATWAEYDGCGAWAQAGAGGTLDIDARIPGTETTVAAAVGCPSGVGVELWTIDGGGHIPALGPGFITAVFDFLGAHART